jgi:benzoate-CoA ligase
MPDMPPERFNFARHLLCINAGRAHSLAFSEDDRQLRYGELADGVRRFAGALRALDVQSGERVLLILADQIEWPVAYLGAMYAGVVPVPINTLLTADDYAFVLANSQARAVIAGADLLSKVEEALEKAALAATPAGSHEAKLIVVGTRPEGLPRGAESFEALLSRGDAGYAGADTHRDEPAFWLYSSGSTGRPKGVVHTHANLFWTAELYAKPVMGVSSADRIFSAAKLFFAYGLGNSLTFPLSVGASSVLMRERPTPEAVLKRLQRHEATIFCGAPTLYASLLAAETGTVPRSLRLCTSAGEALPQEVGTRFSERHGVPILDGLGSTELLHIFLSNRASDLCYGTTGRPVDGYELELRDEVGRVIEGDEEIGDLWVKGPSAALRYWKEEEKSNHTFQQGWVRTGDKYVRRKDGRFTYAGRNDDMLRISGQYVSPFEVESTLMQHPDVLESAVVAIADELGISRSCAYVVLKPGRQPAPGTAEELKAFVKARLAPHKRPYRVEFVADLPKTATGKIQRFRLRLQSKDK